VQLRALGLYSHDGRLRPLRFEQGALNVISGLSRTGKTELLKIVDFCSGRRTPNLAPGPITRKVAWFAALFQAADGRRVLVMRPQPTGQSTTTAMVAYGVDIDLPSDSSSIEINATTETVRGALDDLLGLGGYDIEEFGGTRERLRASVSHAIQFCLQAQTELMSPTHLFHRGGEEDVADDFAELFPYFIGAVDEDVVAARRRAGQLRRQQRDAERRLERLQSQLEADQTRDRALVEQAIQLGLISSEDAEGDPRERLANARKALVRERSIELMDAIDDLLPTLTERFPNDGTALGGDSEWERLAAALAEIQRLLGNDLVRRGRWTELARHLSFAQGADVHDIANHDWPSVRPDVEAALYGQLEPLPVEVEDLGTLVASRPAGAVSTALRWDVLDEDDFERLLFNLLGDAQDYENPRWLMKTRAADRGRDLSVDRVVPDSLSGPRQQRVIVQCKHWLDRSVGLDDCAATVAAMSVWEPPPVDVLVIATSGRFTADAVRWIENHNNARKHPTVEMWPESHLELAVFAGEAGR
jgi:hypothetical protein